MLPYVLGEAPGGRRLVAGARQRRLRVTPAGPKGAFTITRRPFVLLDAPSILTRNWS
jgi:hypothetical protein